MSNQLEPTWVARVEDWWNKLLGPTLSGVFERIRKQAGTSGLLEATYGETVRRFEAELSELQADVADFEAAAGQTEWAPYAARARQVAERINGQWTDPSATKKGGVAGVFNPVASVVRTVNVSVTAIGVAWAVASIAEVLHARKLLARWSEELENGVHPSRRDRRQAHLEGEDDFGGDWWDERHGRRRERRSNRRRDRNRRRREYRKNNPTVWDRLNPYQAHDFAHYADILDGVDGVEGEDEFGRRGRFGRGRRFGRGPFGRGRGRRFLHRRGQAPHPAAQHGGGGLASEVVAQMNEDGDPSEFGIDPEAIFDDPVFTDGFDEVSLPDGQWGLIEDASIVYAGIGTEELAV